MGKHINEMEAPCITDVKPKREISFKKWDMSKERFMNAPPRTPWIAVRF